MSRKDHAWVGLPGMQDTITQEEAVTVMFRQVLEYHGGAFPVCMTADSRYKLFVNGQLLHFGPAKGDDKLFFYDRIDLGPWLKDGKNALCVSVLHYPVDGEKGNHSLFRSKHPGLWAEGPGLNSWRCRANPYVRFYAEEERFAPLQIHEQAGTDSSLSGWLHPDYDDSSWPEAEPIPASELLPSQSPACLQLRTVPFARLCSHTFSLPLSSIPAYSERSFVLDAGEEMCAFPTLHLSGGKGTEIELLYSECYVTDDGKGNRLDWENGHLEGYRDFYTVGGVPSECYRPFWFRTFRFLSVTVRTGAEPLMLEELSCLETGYPLEEKTRVQTSDPSLELIWDISVRTLRRCMHDSYMDCPFYEQLQYVMDTRAQALYTYCISADDRLARKAIDDFSRAQRPDGLLNCSYPNVNVNVIPGFSLYYILMLHDHMMYFGDRAFLARYMPCVHRILEYFRRSTREDGLVKKIGGVNGKAPFWSFIDWAREWMPTEGMPAAGLYGPLTAESLLYLMGLQKTAELLDFTGEAGADACREEAAELGRRIRECCMDDSGMLTDGPGRCELSQQTQVLGILTGTLSMEEGRRNLLRTIEDPEIPKCTVAMSLYLFRALEMTGLYEHTDQYWNVWRDMIANGCTTCVEGENYARSECHAWGALALYELPSAILGVRPGSPGYETIVVRPVPGILTHASGTVVTPHGELSVSWERTESGLSVEIQTSDDVKRRLAAK